MIGGGRNDQRGLLGRTLPSVSVNVMVPAVVPVWNAMLGLAADLG